MGKLAPTRFSTAYKNDCFLTWYQQGRPPNKEFWLSMPLDNQGNRPNIKTLDAWMIEWRKQAKELDAEVEHGLIEEVVAKKVEMLRRHSEDAKEIQDIALTYLRENKEELTPHAAVRLLQLGVEIERESVGVPEALEKMSKLDDQQLLDEISAILKDSNVDISMIEDEDKSVED